MKIITQWAIARTKNHGYPYLIGWVNGFPVTTSPIVEVLGNGACRTVNTIYKLQGHTNELDNLDLAGAEKLTKESLRQ